MESPVFIIIYIAISVFNILEYGGICYLCRVFFYSYL